VSWLGSRDRRRRPRRPYEPEQEPEPTYLVERDAPPGPPLDPTGRWLERTVRKLRGVATVDAYPDHETPFEVAERIGPTVPVSPVAARLPKPRQHPVSLFVKRNGKLREVQLIGLPLEIAIDKLNRRLMAGWVMNEIAGTLEQMEADEMEEQEHRREIPGQGLAEYALILALIAIVTIAALILLGGQIQDALNDIGQSILPQ